MKTLHYAVLIALLGLGSLCIVLGVLASRSGHFSILLPVQHKSEFTDDQIAQFPSRLSASGNQIVNVNGNIVLLKGLMPPDPARLNSEDRFGQDFFFRLSETGANVVRIPVHPERWVRDRDYPWRYLDPIVAWAGEYGMYVIIDWHYIGNVATGTGPQMPDLEDKPKDLSIEFWQLTARYFRGAPNVIFEIFNEPQSITADEWRSNATEIIRVIREQGATQLVIVGGIDYGKDLSWVLEHPINDSNIAYASHIYPAHARNSWEHWLGTVADKYPVVITEWGFMEDAPASQSYLVGSPTTFGEPFLEYLNARQIGWVACWYDDEWLPPMFMTGMQDYTRYGAFVMQQLSAAN